jgi:hypothetical protein
MRAHTRGLAKYFIPESARTYYFLYHTLYHTIYPSIIYQVYTGSLCSPTYTLTANSYG